MALITEKHVTGLIEKNVKLEEKLEMAVRTLRDVKSALFSKRGCDHVKDLISNTLKEVLDAD